MLRVEALEVILYGCVTLILRACHHDTLRRAYYSFLTRCIDWRKGNHTDRPIFYLDVLMKTGSESIEAIMRRRRILFARSVARMEDTRLPKCVLFGRLVGGAGCTEGQEKEEWTRCLLMDLRAFGMGQRPVDECIHPWMRGNGARRRNKGRNVSCVRNRCRESQGWTTA